MKWIRIFYFSEIALVRYFYGGKMFFSFAKLILIWAFLAGMKLPHNVTTFQLVLYQSETVQ